MAQLIFKSILPITDLFSTIINIDEKQYNAIDRKGLLKGIK